MLWYPHRRDMKWQENIKNVTTRTVSAKLFQECHLARCRFSVLAIATWPSRTQSVATWPESSGSPAKMIGKKLCATASSTPFATFLTFTGSGGQQSSSVHLFIYIFDICMKNYYCCSACDSLMSYVNYDAKTCAMASIHSYFFL